MSNHNCSNDDSMKNQRNYCSSMTNDGNQQTVENNDDGDGGDGTFRPSYKRRRFNSFHHFNRKRRKFMKNNHHDNDDQNDQTVPVSHFLFGGINFNDPLNLKSTNNNVDAISEDGNGNDIGETVNINRNPKSIPNHKSIEETVNVVIPTNFQDPLNLKSMSNDIDSNMTLNNNNDNKSETSVNKHIKSYYSRRNRTSSESDLHRQLSLPIMSTSSSLSSFNNSNKSSMINIKNRIKDDSCLNHHCYHNVHMNFDDNNTNQLQQQKQQQSMSFSSSASTASTSSTSTLSIPQKFSRFKHRRNYCKYNHQHHHHNHQQQHYYHNKYSNTNCDNRLSINSFCNNDNDGNDGGHIINQQSNSNFKQKKFFQYGNYNRYYGYRSMNTIDDDDKIDPRLKLFKQEWFENKVVLDVGCNVGHITMVIAKKFRPKQIIGVDIDETLIDVAKRNLRKIITKNVVKFGDYPLSLSYQYGDVDCFVTSKPIATTSAHIDEATEGDGKDKGEGDNADDQGTDDAQDKAEGGDADDKGEGGNPDDKVEGGDTNDNTDDPKTNDQDDIDIKYPNNVNFLHLNYVPEIDDDTDDLQLLQQKEEFDCILCLSVTKWIQLNWLDRGLKRTFHRMYQQLRPGGVLILEPQPWSSYKKSKMTPQLKENFRQLRFKPEHYHEYLLKDVGFKSCEMLGTPDHEHKGFQRPIYLYTKKI